MKGRCNFIYKLIIATVILFASATFILPSTSFAATNSTTITFNGVDRNFYYEAGSILKGNKKAAYSEGDEKDPLVLDIYYDRIIFDFAGADKFSYPIYFELYNSQNIRVGRDAHAKKVMYVKYLVQEKTEEKKVVFEKIAEMAEDSPTFYTVTPNNETTGKTYIQPGATYKDDSDKMGYTPPLYTFTSNIMVNAPAGTFTDGLGALFDTKKIWQFEQILGNTTIPVGMASNAASYPTAYVFMVTDTSKIQMPDLFKFSNKQVNEKVAVTIKEKQGTNAWQVLSGSWLVHAIMGDYKLSPATYNTIAEQTLQNSRITLDLTNPGLEIKSFVYVFNGPSSDALDGSDANAIEEVIAKILISLGSVFRGAIGLMDGGSELSIDALIFNEYKQTKLDFFEPDGGVYTTLFDGVINGWFEAFQQFALMILILLIPAIAVKVVMYSGTPDQKKVPGMISGWVIAIMLMFFGPYLMKYVIKLNNTIVKIFRDNSEYSIYSVYNADFIASHEWAQDYQIGEDSETSFLDWLQQNIDQTQKEWSTAAQELGLISGEMEAMAAEISRMWRESQSLLGRIGSFLIDMGLKGIQNFGDLIEESLVLDYRISGIDPGGRTDLTTILSLIDTAGKNKQFTSSTRATVSEVYVSIGGTEYSMQWLDDTIRGLTDVAQGILDGINNVVGTATEWVASGINAVWGWITGSDEDLIDVEEVRSKIDGVFNQISDALDVVSELLTLRSQMERRLNTQIQNWIKYWELQETIAEMEDALALFTKNLDLENAMKERAAKTYRLVLVAIWYILIYQLVLLMFLYYKRLLTVAVLIILFPLVIMFYGIERFMGIDRPAAFKTWVQEFLINVFIQCVHALLYVSLVETGLRIYEADPDNWVVLIFAITAIIPMEGIIKAMLGLKGSTVTSLAASAAKGAMLAGSAVAIGKMVTQGSSKKEAEERTKALNKKVDEKAARQDNRTDLRRNIRDNAIRFAEMHGLTKEGSASKKLAKLHEKDAKKDQAKKDRREKIKDRNERMERYRRAGKIARNITGAVSAVSIGLAAGADPEDMKVASGIGSVIAGKKPKKDKKENKPETGAQDTRNDIAQNAPVLNAQPTQGAQNARNAADQAANNPNPQQPNPNVPQPQNPGAEQPPVAKEASALQNAMGEGLRNAGVPKSTGTLEVNAHSLTTVNDVPTGAEDDGADDNVTE